MATLRADPVPEFMAGGAADQDTAIIANAFEHDPYSATTRSFPMPDGVEPVPAADGRADPTLPEPLREDALTAVDDAPTQVGRDARDGTDVIDASELMDLGTSTAAADLQMDWDDDEVQTQLRDEQLGARPVPAPLSAPPPSPSMRTSTSGLPSPFPMSSRPSAPAFGYPGAPSPFAAGDRASEPMLPPAPDLDDLDGAWDDDDAVTRVAPSGMPLPGMLVQPPMSSVAPVSRTLPPETLAGNPFATRRPVGLIAGLAVAAAAILGLAYGGRDLLRGDDAASITLVTTPPDAQVLVDGRPLTGQTSPFTVQGLIADVVHQVEVRRDGYAPSHVTFSLLSGEVKALENVVLDRVQLDTGFALTSEPSGARVFVDGKALSATTPTRITDLEAGLHTVRLEHGDGFQPWQTQIALAAGQVIELPVAGLTPVEAVDVDADQGAVVAKADTRSKASRRRSGSARTARPARAASSSSKVAAAPASGGNQGQLRINSRPWSQVFVDGRLIGNTPQLNIGLAPGRHTVKLVNPDMGMSKRLSVTVKAGQATTKIVNLLE